MAEAETASKAAGSSFGFLGHKLFGKVPVWVVAVAGVGGYYWYTKYGPGKKAASTQPAGSGTDPAGNTGLINPSTGYVYGTPEDLAALNGAQTQGIDTSGGGGSSAGGGGSTQPPPLVIPGEPPPLPVPGPRPPVKGPRRNPGPGLGSVPPPTGGPVTPPGTWSPGVTGHTTANTNWGNMAVGNLISQGVPPDQASTSIQAHLNGQPLSPAMAANTKLAVDSIGSPPHVPEPGRAKAPQTAGKAY